MDEEALDRKIRAVIKRLAKIDRAGAGFDKDQDQSRVGGRKKNGPYTTEEQMNAFVKAFKAWTCVGAFPHNVMRDVLNEIVQMYPGENIKDWNFRIYDPFAGWGDRMMSTYVLGKCYNVEAYLGIDSNPDMEEPYNNIKNFLGGVEIKHLKIRPDISFRISPSENVSAEEIRAFNPNFIITSPPYPGYNGVGVEMYSQHPDQAYIKYKSLDEYINLFFKTWFYNCLDGLREGGFFALNVADGVFGAICNHVLELADEFPRADVSLVKVVGLKMGLAAGHGKTKDARAKNSMFAKPKKKDAMAVEPIFIWRKRGKKGNLSFTDGAI